MLLAGVGLATRQAFQSGRTKSQPDVSTETTEFDAAKDSRSSSFASTLVAPSEATSRIDHLLSRDIYLDNVWLLPTLFNIGSAIFLFFQLIVSSSGGNAASLFVSIAYSTTVVCVACGSIIMVGLAVSELPLGRWIIWGIAVQPLAAIAWLSAVVMTHGVSFGDREQLMVMGMRLLAFWGILVVQYAIICICICCCPRYPRKTILATVRPIETSAMSTSMAVPRLSTS